MFNFFSRKSANVTEPAEKSIGDSLAEASLRNQQLRTPSPSVNSAIGKNNSNLSPHPKGTAQDPPITPSPPPDNLLDKDLGLITDPSALHSLISSVPPKVLHEYILTHLIPPARSSKPIHPPSSLTLTHLTSFFSTLHPPAALHCVRCHKFYYEAENAERSCLVPHDDESAEVERVGGDTQYETLWNCCGQTVEGDGDMGPPDGWCYEGKHTTDTKRARFRADSTMHHDKLTSCDRLKCFEPRESDSSSESSVTSSPRPRKRKRSTRKREEAAAAEENAEEPPVDDDDDTRSVTSTRSQVRLKKKLKMVPTAPNSPLASSSAPASTSKPRKKRTKPTHDDKPFKPEATPIDDDDMDVDESASVISKRAPKGSKSMKLLNLPPNNSVSTIEFAPSPDSSPNHASASADERQRKQSVSFAPMPVIESSGSTKSAKPRRPRTKKLG
ncbi:hypothetical protein BT96DRAFT_927183 [Gymnopus androsaceus JB14]|uniref:C2H2-type domain-containing protein n=1 Tax=Gymnopus androsaceus JB14 TaxID=1447944 RepID=A0A6A4GSI1_9AGAR|nr:hypothetical protein BT96DRAFT_927183 [Gymnopus androsaceus JB14]